MPNKKYKIAVIQLNLNDVAENNLKKCLSWVRDAANQGAEVITLPELYSSHYFCQSEDVDNFALAEPLYSTSFIAFFYEKFYFTPGDLGFKTIPTQKGKIGTLICWDQWYPEAARLTALSGSEVLFYPTAIGWHPEEKEQYGENQYGAWMNVMKGHAVANGVYVAAANRIGLEQYLPDTAGIEFWGASFIAGPQGEILAQASHDKEEILIAEVDLDLQENVRQNWPFFRDRRIDAFGDITKRAID
jgi:N-carbamoylputrescine amidase